MGIKGGRVMKTGTYYSFNRYNNSLAQSSFSPTSTNWFISASGKGQTYYFPNLSSFKHWSNTCCGQSRDAISSGKLGDYTISYNRPL